MNKQDKELITQRIIEEVIDPLLSYVIEGQLQNNMTTVIGDILDNPKLAGEIMPPLRELESLEDLDY